MMTRLRSADICYSGAVNETPGLVETAEENTRVKQRHLEILIMGSLALLVTALINMHSVLSLVLFGALFMLVHRRLFHEENHATAMGVFSAYALFAVLLFLSQLWTIPHYNGFTGPEGGIGTDDAYYFSLVARDLPDDFPIRPGRYVPQHHYADILKIVAAPFYALFGRLHLLDLVFFNLMGLSLVPFFTTGIARQLKLDSGAVRVVFWTTLLCPFLLSNGLILVRDGWITAFFIGALWALLSRRPLVLIWCVVGLFWLRIGSGLMLVVTGGMFGALFWNTVEQDGIRRWRPTTGGIAKTVVFATVALAMFAIFGGQSGDGQGIQLFRQGYVEGMLTRSSMKDSGTTTFFLISHLPIFLRLPLALVFFLGSPFLSLSSLQVDGIWVPRHFMANAFAVMFMVYVAWFCRGVLRAFRERHLMMIVLILVICVDLLIVSQASMQLRHKLAIMPLFYLAVGYGATTMHRGDRSLAWLASGIVLIANIAVNVLPFLPD